MFQRTAKRYGCIAIVMAIIGVMSIGNSQAQTDEGEFVCGTTEADLVALPGATEPVASASLAGRPPKGSTVPTCMTEEHIFLYEDTDGILARVHTASELMDLKVAATNALIAQYGDNFDFVGFWTNLEPVTRFGGAHFQTIKNDVQGIGSTLFDNHAALGLAGSRLQGMATMYNFHIANTSTAPNALAHEFAHRWVVRLRPMPDGRTWGGGHFICRVDQQGGAHGAEWHGTDPATPRNRWMNFDTGDRHSHLVLYLAGYVTAAEMDAEMSEQRYMNEINPSAPDLPCLHNYRGSISNWSSAEIIATNGARIPAADSSDAQHDFTVGWILFYEPGQIPPRRDVSKLLRTTERFHMDWVGQTLGRGTLSGQLFPDADCDGVPDPTE